MIKEGISIFKFYRIQVLNPIAGDSFQNKSPRKRKFGTLCTVNTSSHACPCRTRVQQVSDILLSIEFKKCLHSTNESRYGDPFLKVGKSNIFSL